MRKKMAGAAALLLAFVLVFTLSAAVSAQADMPAEGSAGAPAAGTYEAEITSSFAMLIASGSTLKGTLTVASDGTMTCSFTTLMAHYSKLYIGAAVPPSETDPGIITGTAVTDSSGNVTGYTFSGVPVSALGSTFTIGIFNPGHSAADAWYTKKTVTLTVNSSSAAASRTSSAAETTTAATSAAETTAAQTTAAETASARTTAAQPSALADGIYTASVSTDAAMMKFQPSCRLTVTGGEMTAEITLAGSGGAYDMFALDAALSRTFAVDHTVQAAISGGTGACNVFYLPVSALDTALSIYGHSASKQAWQAEHHFTVTNPILISGSGSETAAAETTGSAAGESAAETASSDGGSAEEAVGEIIASHKSGTVADGEYVPSFAYTGGTSRHGLTISCSRVTVSGSSAEAEIVFSSTTFTRMSVNGVYYENQNKGGEATFIIPVTLNGKTAVSAETTAMSQPYWVDYVFYIYVDGQDADAKAVQTAGTGSTDSSEAAPEAQETDNFEAALALKESMDALKAAEGTVQETEAQDETGTAVLAASAAGSSPAGAILVVTACLSAAGGGIAGYLLHDRIRAGRRGREE